MGPRGRAGLFRAISAPLAVVCALSLSLFLASCGGGGGGGGEATVTLTGTALVPPPAASPKAGDPGSLEKDQPFAGSRVVAISLRDGRMFPGPQGAAVDGSGRFSISGCPKGHRFLIRAWKGARSVERITHRADDDDGDGVHEDGPVDTASTAACIRLGKRVSDRMGGRSHIERGDFSPADADEIEAALDDLEDDVDDSETRRLGDDFDDGNDLCTGGDLDNDSHRRINAFLACRSVIRASRDDQPDSKDDLRDWLEHGTIEGSHVSGRVMHRDCTLHDDPDLDPNDLPDGDTTPPDTTITDGPPDFSSATDATFEFTSTEDGSTFACELDGGGPAACTSGETYSGLAEGSHSFSVAATDPSDNTDPTPATRDWTVDLTPPVINLLGTDPVTVAQGSTYTDAGATAQDDVDGDITGSIVVGGLGAVDTSTVGDYPVTYDVSDAAGNPAAQVTRTVQVRDLTPPVLSGVPANQTVEATDPTGALVTYTDPTATDAVDPAPSVGCVPPSGSTFSLGTTTVTCTATDASGNQATATFDVTVEDTIAPVLTVPADTIVEAPGDTSPTATGTATAVDAVDAAPSVTFSDAPVPGTGQLLSTITRTWTATDASGNSASDDQVIQVMDTTPPSLSGVPADQTVEATGPAGAAVNFTDPTATDTVDPAPSVDCVPVSGSPFALGDTTVTCTATDASGNVDAANFTVTVEDTTPPTVTAPAAITVTSSGGTPVPATDPAIAAFLAGATASDIVDGVIGTITNDAPATFALGALTVTFSATDAASNTGTATSTVTVLAEQDVTPPVITLLGSDPVTVAVGATYTDAGATALDDVDGDITANIVVGGLPIDTSAVGDSVVTYDVTDSSGNPATQVTRTVQVRDQTPPVLTVPSDITLEAPANESPTGPAGTATATDNVDPSPVVTFSDVVTPGTGQLLRTITRTWTATDAAGNSASADQIIQVMDTTPPNLVVPDDTTVEAPGDTSPTATGTATADDTVDPVPVVTFSDVNTPGTGQLLLTITRTWTATDASGNSTSADQIIQVMDTTPPVLSGVPADQTVEATGPAGAAATFVDPTATDAVDTAPSVACVPASGSIFPLGTTTVTCTATDASGNSATATFDVTVEDTTAPTVTAPAPISVQSPGGVPVAATDPAIAAFLAGATATDLVDGAVTPVTNDAPSSFPLGPTTVTFSATDAAGNTGTATSTVTVAAQDVTPPVITLLGSDPVTVAQGSTYTDAGATALDDVDGDITANIVTVNPVNTNVVGDYTVTYDVSDAAGNPATQVTRTVQVRDQTPPVLTVPADIILEAPANTTPAATGTATATDNVDPAPVVTFSDVNTPGTGQLLFTITRTWTATDASGNSASADQTIQVMDTTPPVVSAPAPISVPSPGGAPVPDTDPAIAAFLAGATANDAVDGAVTPVTNDAPSSFPLGPTTVTFSATDAAGNTGTATSTVTVTAQDVTPPVITLLGTDPVTVDVGSTYVDAGATALDDVDGDITANIVVGGLGAVDTSTVGDYAVTYDVSDAAGNPAVQVTRTVQVRDLSPPVITPPTPITVQSATGDPVPATDPAIAAFLAGATADDNLDGPITTITNDAPTEFALGTTVVTFSATDAAGNTGTATSTVAVVFDRCAGATVFWTAAVDGTWNNPANWSSDPDLPGPTDIVCIDVPQDVLVTHNTGTDQIDTLLDYNRVTLSGGVLGIASASVVAADFTISGGTLTGTGDVTVTAPFHWAGGSMTGTGATVVEGDATLDTTTKSLSRPLNVAATGTATWTFGGINFQNDAAINNAGNFRADHQNSLSLNNGGGTGTKVFNNTGTFTKVAQTSGTPGITTIGTAIAFNNSGTVSVEQGTLNISGGGTSSGTFDAASGAVVGFNSSTHTLDTGASFTGAGVGRVSGGTVTLAGNIPAENFQITTGTLNGAGDLTVSNVLTWGGGTMAGTGTTVAQSTANLNGSTKNLSRTLSLPATATANWTSGGVNFQNDSAINNAGTFRADHQNNLTLNNGGGVGTKVFNNTGAFIKVAQVSGTPGTTTIGGPIAFNNSGSVSVEEGAFNIAGGGTSTGTFDMASGAAVGFTGSTHTLDTGASFTGAGVGRVAGGIVTVAGNVPAENFEITNGTLNGVADLTVSNVFTWSGGTMAGTGTTVAQNTANLNGSTKNLSRTLSLPATATANWTSGGVNFQNDAAINNAGTFNVAHPGNANFNNGSGVGTKEVNNTGSFVKTVPSGGSPSTTTIGSPIAFNNSGTVSVEDQFLNLAGGTSTGSFDTTLSTALVVFNSGTHILDTGASFTGDGRGVVAGGTVTLAANVPAQNFQVSGGTLNGVGDLTVAGEFTWVGGTMSGSGATVVNGTAAIRGTSKTLDRQLDVAATATADWTAGSIFFANTATINNAGLFIAAVAGNTNLNNSGGTGAKTFNNTGTFEKRAPTTGSVGITTVGNPVAFNNSGTVDVQDGELRISGTGIHTGAFDASGGLLNFNSDNTFQSGSTVTGAAEVQISAATSNFLASSTYDVAGTTTISGGTLALGTTKAVTMGVLDQSGGTLAGSDDVTVAGLLTWTSGTMAGSGSTTAGGGADLSSGSKTIRGDRTFVIPNGQTADWTAGNIFFGDNGTLDNAGTFNIAHANNLNLSNTGGTGTRGITNTGAFVKMAPATGTVGITQVVSPVFFNNDGTVDVQDGEFRVGGTGVHTGSFDSSGGLLNFASDNTFQSGSTVTGAAEVQFSNGTSNFLASSTYDVSGTTTISGGTLDLSTTKAVTMGVLNQSGGTLAGSDDVTVADLLTWTTGTMAGTGTTTADGGADLSASSKTIRGDRTFIIPNGQTADWTGGNIFFGDNGTLNNAGTFNIAHANNVNLTNTGGTGTRGITNTGTFVKMAPTTGTVGLTTVVNPVFFDNDGTVDVQDGEFRISGGGTHTGDFQATGGLLNFASANTFQSGSTVTGAAEVQISIGPSTFLASSTYDVAGTTSISSGTLDLSTTKAVSIGAFNMTGGTLTGSDDVTVTGLLTWTTGTMAGTGTTTAGGGADLSGSSKSISQDRTFIVPNGQTADWTGGTFFFVDSGTLNNAGTFNDAHANNLNFTNGGGTGTRGFNNTGTFVKMAPTTGTVGLTTVVQPVFFNNSGTVDLQAGTFSSDGPFTQTAGTTTLNGGTLQGHLGATTTLDFQGGQLLGAGTVNGNLLVSGAAVVPGFSPGTITVTGTYTQASGASLDIELGGLTAGTGYDQVVVNGAATLGGTLNVSLFGGFVPQVGDAFDVVTYGSLTTGSFTLNLPGGAVGNVTYGTDRATLTITTAPSPKVSGAANLDPDLDGLTTADEVALGTDPADPDSDDDGVGDGIEVLAGADPLTAEAAGKVLFVAATGDDAQPGTDWAGAKATTAAALAAAPDGAAGAPTFILHGAGTYPGGVSVTGRTGVVLVGSVGPVTWYPFGDPSSVLDAAGAPTSAVTVVGGGDVTLIGLELTGGQATDGGGLLVLDGGPVRVFEASIRGNTAAQRGGGAYVENAILALTHSRVVGNDALAGGGGLYVNGGSVDVEDTLIAANRAGADGGGIGLVLPVGTVRIFNNLLVGNVAATGGAVALTDPGAGTSVLSNTMAWNQATTAGGGGALAYANPGLGAEPVVADNVLWHNEDASVEAAAQAGDTLSGPITDAISTHNDIGQGAVNAGTDISVDPGFTHGFYLNQALVAPAGPVDGGSATAASRFAGSATTDAAGTPDAGQADMGFHHDGAAEAGTLTVVVAYPAPLQGLMADQAVVITPQVAGADLGAGHRVAVRPGAGTTTGVALSAPSTLDPLFTGDSVLAHDNGDGTYTVSVDTTAAATGGLTLDVHVDDLPPQAGSGATGF